MFNGIIDFIEKVLGMNINTLLLIIILIVNLKDIKIKKIKEWKL